MNAQFNYQCFSWHYVLCIVFECVEVWPGGNAFQRCSAAFSVLKVFDNDRVLSTIVLSIMSHMALTYVPVWWSSISASDKTFIWGVVFEGLVMTECHYFSGNAYRGLDLPSAESDSACHSFPLKFSSPATHTATMSTIQLWMLPEIGCLTSCLDRWRLVRDCAPQELYNKCHWLRIAYGSGFWVLIHWAHTAVVLQRELRLESTNKM